MRVERNYYEVLGVDRNVDSDGLKQARNKKFLETHPDKNPGGNTTAEFRLVVKAYQVLSNSQERASYDRSLDSPFERPQPEEPKVPQSPPSPTFFKPTRVGVEVNDEYDFLYKFVFIGAAHKSMKTKIINAMIDDSISSRNSVGVDFRVKKLLVENVGVVKVQLWDTAGQERFHTMGKIQLKGAAGVVVVVDTASAKTLKQAIDQLSSYKEQGLLDDMIIHLIVVDSDPALREFNDMHIDSFCQRFCITQRVEVNLEAPDAILLDQFLVNLVKEFYEKDVKLPADSLRSDSNNDEEASQIVKEDDAKCCIM